MLGLDLAPHHSDVPLKDIVDIILTARPQAVSFPAANPRHEPRVEDLARRQAAGRQDHHPRRDRFDRRTSSSIPSWSPTASCNYASVVGRENVIAGVDCGFGTFAGRVQVDSKIVWMKLASLAEGARRASQRLWANAA